MGLVYVLWGLTLAGVISALVDFYAFERLMNEGLYEI